MADRAGVKSNAGAAARQRASADQLAVAALEFIAAEPRRLARFLDMTGIAPESIREASREANFLAGVLDHLSEDEALLVAFCAQDGVDPNELMRARAVLGEASWESDTL